jgi:hypothetical protein
MNTGVNEDWVIYEDWLYETGVMRTRLYETKVNEDWVRYEDWVIDEAMVMRTWLYEAGEQMRTGLYMRLGYI